MCRRLTGLRWECAELSVSGAQVGKALQVFAHAHVLDARHGTLWP